MSVIGVRRVKRTTGPVGAHRFLANQNLFLSRNYKVPGRIPHHFLRALEKLRLPLAQIAERRPNHTGNRAQHKMTVAAAKNNVARGVVEPVHDVRVEAQGVGEPSLERLGRPKRIEPEIRVAHRRRLKDRIAKNDVVPAARLNGHCKVSELLQDIGHDVRDEMVVGVDVVRHETVAMHKILDQGLEGRGKLWKLHGSFVYFVVQKIVVIL